MNDHSKSSNAELILAAAEACIIEKHLPKVTMEVIAKHAGLSRKTVYRTFENKDQILGELFEKHLLNSISRKVKAKIKKLSLEESVIQGNLITIRQIKKDPFLVEAIEGNGAAWFQKQLKNYDSEIHSRIRAGSLTMWNEKLNQCRNNGELNPELTNEEIVDWFSIINYSLIIQENEDKSHYINLIRKFVLPALRGSR